jgi:hypothetical protein
MRFRGLLLCALVLAVVPASLATPAKAAMRIAEDRGGQIGHYLQAFAMLRSSGERVIIDGNCLSACTLVLGLIPRQRICATPRARFGFHAAWMPDVDGRPVTSPMGTQALWSIYPQPVKHWIRTHGGLSRKMIYMQGRDLRGIVASCGETIQRAEVRPSRRAASRASAQNTRRVVRYTSASAASDRR